jgi:hypothetical protein
MRALPIYIPPRVVTSSPDLIASHVTTRREVDRSPHRCASRVRVFETVDDDDGGRRGEGNQPIGNASHTLLHDCNGGREAHSIRATLESTPHYSERHHCVTHPPLRHPTTSLRVPHVHRRRFQRHPEAARGRTTLRRVIQDERLPDHRRDCDRDSARIRHVPHRRHLRSRG